MTHTQGRDKVCALLREVLTDDAFIARVSARRTG